MLGLLDMSKVGVCVCVCVCVCATQATTGLAISQGVQAAHPVLHQRRHWMCAGDIRWDAIGRTCSDIVIFYSMLYSSGLLLLPLVPCIYSRTSLKKLEDAQCGHLSLAHCNLMD